MAQDTLYFPHDYDPLSDSGLRRLVRKHGAVGYGVYWRIIEYLHANAEHRIRFDSGIYDDIADDLNVPIESIDTIFNDCINGCMLLDADGEAFWSNRVVKNVNKRKEISEKRSLAAKASVESRKKNKELADEYIQTLANAQQVLNNR